MDFVIEILKITIPALIVFLTVYFMMKSHHKQQYQLQILSLRQKNTQHSIPLKLQAYERLTMLCERMSIPNLIVRLRTKNMTVTELTNSMLIAIKQEYDHNLTQQVYISDELWSIITLVKNNVLTEISDTSKNIEPNANAQEMIKILSNMEIESAKSINHAKRAIKEELNLQMV